MSRLVVEDTEHVASPCVSRVFPRQRFASLQPASLPDQRAMRPAEEEDDGMEMGGTLDPEDGLQGVATKARPMPKW